MPARCGGQPWPPRCRRRRPRRNALEQRPGYRDTGQRHGEFKGITGFRAFGDPDTKGFQRGEKFGALAALFPTPGSVLRDGEQLAVRGGERLLADGVETSAKRQLRPHASPNNSLLLTSYERYRPEQGMPVLGRLKDTARYVDKPGYAVLQLDDWKEPKNFQWIDDIAEHRQPVELVSPEKGNRVQTVGDRAGEPTIYARELDYLREQYGYTRQGTQLLPRP